LTAGKAEIEKDGKIKLISTRSFETQMGAMAIKTVEVWELLDNGKTLKITRETETPRGSQSSEMYFTKKDLSTVVETKDTVKAYQGPVLTVQGDYAAPLDAKDASGGGVLNGSALKLPAPDYPAAAKAVRASGTVNVQVTIDEDGKVISASAVSGHPLLRAAAENAARKCEFRPTRLEGAPVKVTGIIVYNFVL
jgi:TonB family protein